MIKKKFQNGFGLLEVVIGAAIISLIILALVGAFSLAVKNSRLDISRIQAVYLLQGGVEAIKTLRDSSWNANIASLPINTDRYLYWNGSAWSATSTIKYENGFLRSFSLDNVYRDGENDITSGGGTLDANTKKLTVSVAWSESGATTTKQLVTYITNLFSN